MGDTGADTGGRGRAGAGPPAGSLRLGRVRLRLLATSDLHGHLLAWDYHADRAAADRGLARIASLVQRLRRSADLTLLVDNGDFLEGSPLSDAVAAAAPGTEGIHPMIAAMNALGYDAAALGNHEFSHGMGAFLRAIAPARFPILSANILNEKAESPEADHTFLPATALIRRPLAGRQVTIGLVGLTPPQTLAWEAAQIDRPLQARGFLETAASHARALRAAGADLVVALCHGGISLPPSPDEDAAAVAGLEGIDAVVAGHTHGLFPDPALPALPGFDPIRGRIRGKPVVLPGFFGSHLGVIDLVLEPAGTGWRVTGRRARLEPVATRSETGRLAPRVAEDAALRDLALPVHQATRAWASQTIGAVPYRATSHFALIAPCETVRIVARAQKQAVERALARGPHAGLPVVSAAAPYRAGGRGGPDNYTILPRGPLTLRHLGDLYPHPNTLAALLITGQDLVEWLERSASLYRQITPGMQDAPLIDPAFPIFNFDSIEGATYRFDLSQPARYDAAGRLIDPASHRLRDLRVNGRVLAPGDRLVLATNNYRLSGAGGFAEGLDNRVILQAGPSRAAIRAYIGAQAELPPPPPPNWGFVPLPGTSVVVDSAPGAVETIPALPALQITPLEQRPDGFRRFRLTLDAVKTRA